MSATKNSIRTGASTGFAVAVGTIAGGLCAGSGFGTLATGGCAMGGGMAGGKFGDWFGGVTYHIGDFAYQRGIRPLGEGAGKAGEFAYDHGIKQAGHEIGKLIR